MWPMPKGTLYGAHGEGDGSDIIPLQRKYRAHGASLAVVLGVHNPGLCVEAKELGVPLTIARWLHPNRTYEGGGDGVHTWTQAMRLDFVRSAIDLIFTQANDTEYAGSDFFTPGLNEWDHQHPEGWVAAAETLIMLCDEATRRSPEKTSRGFHPIRLAIPGFNAGTPKTWEMYQAIVATGLFARMKARGDIICFHEGVGFGQPIDFGMGSGPTGAPPMTGAGAMCFRSDYLMYLLRQRNEEVCYVMGEWYDGFTRPDPIEPRFAAMKWYDRQLRRRPFARGFCVFELTNNPSSPWYRQDFTPVFSSDVMLADMIAEKDKTNPPLVPTGGDGMEQIDPARRQRIYGHLNAIRDELGAVPDQQPVLYRVRVVRGVQVRDRAGGIVAAVAGDPLTGIIAAGAELTVFEEFPLAPFGNRVAIHPDGRNVWVDNVVKI